MDYFSKFLKPTQTSPKVQIDRALEFHKSWNAVKVTILFRFVSFRFVSCCSTFCVLESCVGRFVGLLAGD